MPTFGLKSPDAYCLTFHQAMMRGLKECIEHSDRETSFRIFDPMTYKESLRQQKQFNAFKMNIRKHPLHKLNYVLQTCVIRCEVVEGAEGFYLRLKFKSREGKLAALAYALRA